MRLRREQIARLGRLLEMKYRPSELANEIGCHVDTIYRSYIPAGCPHTRDETGHIWIVGTEFVEWVEATNSRGGISLKCGEAFCMKCRRPVRMSGTITIRPTNRYLELVSGTCPQCGTTVNRARARQHSSTTHPKPTEKAYDQS